MKTKMSDKELKQIRNKNSRRLESLLSNPDKVRRAAKKMYPKNWQVIFSGEKHPLNQSRDKK
jgi:hypothetical protein